MVMISGNCCKDAHISFAAMDLKKCIRQRELGKKKGRLELTYYKDKDTSMRFVLETHIFGCGLGNVCRVQKTIPVPLMPHDLCHHQGIKS